MRVMPLANGQCTTGNTCEAWSQHQRSRNSGQPLSVMQEQNNSQSCSSHTPTLAMGGGYLEAVIKQDNCDWNVIELLTRMQRRTKEGARPSVYRFRLRTETCPSRQVQCSAGQFRRYAGGWSRSNILLAYTFYYAHETSVLCIYSM